MSRINKFFSKTRISNQQYKINYLDFLIRGTSAFKGWQAWNGDRFCERKNYYRIDDIIKNRI